jgi:hypothetical protein
MPENRRRSLYFLVFTIAMLVLAVALMIVLATRPANAAGSPCPPKHYFCWQVRVAAATFTEAALEDRARACGWTEAQILAARRCLK